MTTDQRIRYELIRDVLRGKPLRILEIGAGSGVLAGILEADGHTVYACDVPTPFGGLERARHGFYADGRKLPVRSESVDATVCSEVLEHVPPGDRAQLFSEIRRATKCGGIMLVSAFVHKTLGFRLWGATRLLATGRLPVWYVEHATIPTPARTDLIEGLPGELIAEQGWVGAPTLAIMFIEEALGISNPPVFATVVAKWLDRFSRKISYMRAVRKAM